MARNVTAGKQPVSADAKRLSQAIDKTITQITALEKQLQDLMDKFDSSFKNLVPGQQADILYTLRETVRKPSNKFGDTASAILKTHSTELLDQLRNNMQSAKLSGLQATASVSETEVYNLVDYDEFAKFVYRNKALYLLDRRISNAGMRELVLSRKGKLVPGVDKFTKYDLGLTKSTKS